MDGTKNKEPATIIAPDYIFVPEDKVEDSKEKGFKEFSKLRPVFKQSVMTSKIILMLSPPYGSLFKNVVNFILKFRL